ncbi:hypothetical protein F5887DRAFT_1075923 [Amanita rubescens]|nr:hypothetical protein F5887DRAFT_1075923 [Amanita rubescens]
MSFDLNQDLYIPGSFPLDALRDIPSDPPLATYENESSRLQDMGQSTIDSARRSREGEIDEEQTRNVAPAVETYYDTLLIRAVAETSTGREVTESALDDNENPPLDAQDGQLRFPEEDFEAVTREIRGITNAAGRRLRVATVPIAAKSDQQSSHYDEIIDPDSAGTNDVYVITNQISVQDRGIEDEPQSPDHEAVLTNAVVEDRLLADYLHSCSQPHHETERKRFRPQSDFSGGTVKPTSVAMEKTRQSVRGPEEDWPHRDVTSSGTLAEPSRLQTEDVRTDSDMTMGAENAGDSSRRSGIAIQQTDGSRPRRWSSDSAPRYYGRAICSGYLATGDDENVFSDSSHPEVATISSQASTSDDLSTISTSESNIVIRPRRRSLVRVSREELALKLQNIQEKTRDNRLAPPLPEGESSQLLPISQSLPSASKPRWWSRTDAKVPRAVVPTAPADRRARATSAIVRFSASQDDLRVDFEPVRPDNEEVIKKASEEPEPGGRNETSKVAQPKKMGLWERIRGIMSGGTSKGASRAEKVQKGEMEDPNG